MIYFIRKNFWIPLSLLIIFFMGSAYFYISIHAKSPIEVKLYEKINNPKIVLGAKVKNWINFLGEAKKIPIEQGNNIFYWPKKGIIAIAHPHYQRQYLSYKNQEDWRISSIILPTKHKIKIKDINTTKTFSFSNIISIEINKKPLEKFSKDDFRKIFRIVEESLDGKLSMGNSSLSLNTLAYYQKKQLQYVEIFVRDYFFSYD